MGQESRQSLAVWFWLRVSHYVAIKIPSWTWLKNLLPGYLSHVAFGWRPQLLIIVICRKLMSLSPVNSFLNAYYLLLMAMKMAWAAKRFLFHSFTLWPLLYELFCEPPFLFEVIFVQFKALHNLFIKVWSLLNSWSSLFSWTRYPLLKISP